MPEIEIFRAGRHTPMQGPPLTFSEADIAAIAAGYDAALSEAPAVIGHPTHDGPAYGWVKGLRTDGGRLLAQVDQVEPQFAEMVRNGRFKKVSASFYPPTSKANPKPGAYYLRHVGFLGAMPPAVKGLAPVAFAGGLADAVDFASGFEFGTIARLLRGIREMMITKAGDDADALTQVNNALPAWEIDAIQDAGAREQAITPSFIEPEPDDMSQQQLADLSAREDKLKADREAFDAQLAAFAEQGRASRAAARALFINDNLDRLAGLQDAAAAFLEFCEGDGATAVSFGEGDQAKTMTPADWFKAVIVPRLVLAVDFSERTAEPSAGVDLDNPAAVAVAAQKYQFAEAQKGHSVDIATAVRHVKGA